MYETEISKQLNFDIPSNNLNENYVKFYTCVFTNTCKVSASKFIPKDKFRS